MTQPAPALVLEAPALIGRPLPPSVRLALRYGVSTMGPLAVSGAHFLASLVFLRDLSAAEFGIFSFVLVVSAFAMGITGAGLVLPATQSLVKGETAVSASIFRLAVVACLLFAVVLTLATMASGAGFSHALPLGLFGATLAYRWFARSLAYIEGRIAAAILSDLLYGAMVMAGLGVMVLTHTVSLRHGGEVLLLAAAASLAAFGRSFLRAQLAGLKAGRLRDYLPAFRNITGWSLLGVGLSEMTLNAHAYLVTFIVGPGAFALPALGMLLMRPAALVQSALPDLERPAMMRAFAARDSRRLTRTLREFHTALALVLLATMLLGAGLLAFAPHLLLKQGYGLGGAALAAALAAAIMTVRAVRTPLAILLQVAGEFKALARLGGWAACISLPATLALLLAFGPVASLGGILTGDIAILVGIWPLAAKARRALHD